MITNPCQGEMLIKGPLQKSFPLPRWKGVRGRVKPQGCTFYIASQWVTVYMPPSIPTPIGPNNIAPIPPGKPAREGYLRKFRD
jgi:hypothetical protein